MTKKRPAEDQQASNPKTRKKESRSVNNPVPASKSNKKQASRVAAPQTAPERASALGAISTTDPAAFSTADTLRFAAHVLQFCSKALSQQQQQPNDEQQQQRLLPLLLEVSTAAGQLQHQISLFTHQATTVTVAAATASDLTIPAAADGVVAGVAQAPTRQKKRQQAQQPKAANALAEAAAAVTDGHPQEDVPLQERQTATKGHALQ